MFPFFQITKKLVKEKKVRVKKSKKKRGLDKVIELQGDTTPDRAAFLQVHTVVLLKVDPRLREIRAKNLICLRAAKDTVICHLVTTWAQLKSFSVLHPIAMRESRNPCN